MLKKSLATLAVAASLTLPVNMQAQHLETKPISYDLSSFTNSMNVEIDKTAKNKSGRSLWWLAHGARAGSTVYDIEATFHFRSECNRFLDITPVTIYDPPATIEFLRPTKDICREANPITKPFIDAGRVPTYLFATGTITLEMYLTDKMRNSSSQILRDTWWLLPVTNTMVHFLAGRGNMRQASGYKETYEYIQEKRIR